MKKRIVIIVFLLLLIATGLLVYFGQQKNRHAELSYSGTIEATRANLAFQASGRVASVPVEEGARVEQGQILAVLEPEEFQSRLEQAEANLEGAMRNRDQIAIILDLYRRTLPEDIIRAEANLRVHREVTGDAEKNYRRFERLFKEEVVTEKQLDTARVNFETARARLDEGDAALRQTRDNLKKIEAAQKDLDASQAQIMASRAILEQSRIQLGYTELRAPFGGIITSRNIEPGEMATPGREVISLADLSRVDLKIFVNATEIGMVRPGQEVEVRVDSFPQRAFEGRVTFISPESEFTPKIIQTRKERVKLVYLVKVNVPNPDLALKPGMPADAWLK